MAKHDSREPLELLSSDTRDLHRAIVSLMEELEAIDWYQQRADACSDPQLKDVLLHNKNEEIEHATMLMEWIRRHNDHFDRDDEEVPVHGGADHRHREGRERADGPLRSAARTLGIGSMKGR